MPPARRNSLYPTAAISESSPPSPPPGDSAAPSPTLRDVPQFPGDFPQPHTYPPPSEMVFRSYYGLRIAAKVWGERPEKGKTREDWIQIMALHGWLDNAATWDLMAPVLLSHALRHIPSKRITLICLDLPGHGLSDHRHRQTEYADWRNAADVEAVREQLGWKKFYLLGHSMGGAVSSLYAGLYPTRILGLALIDNAGIWWRPTSEHPSFLRAFINDAKRAASKRKPLYASVHDALLARSKGSRIPLTYEAATVLVGRGLMEVEVETEEGVADAEAAGLSGYVIKRSDEETSNKEPKQVSSERARQNVEDDGMEDGYGDDEGSRRRIEKKVWYTWRTDPGLTMGRGPMWSDAVVAEFTTRITCPTLMILADTGHWINSLRHPDAALADRQGTERFTQPNGGKARIVVMEGSHHLHLETRFSECGQTVADFFLDRDGARERLGCSATELEKAPMEEVDKQLRRAAEAKL
ncbi:alpha/beta-hydrolase [Gonapodya prolifera JEL478]|uniref:Alpha/beta-hydrolase n=1 Tax=Gonapodya prolifera (strain JEL478) TaxID=1344416 RepID=A0A139AII6_GONPJ|nr:alpha/beta-hydrolase [Gonapodya prolifera JEL478]|eukprot:KXS16626.1 alpha/beta-hydrolase [Gonapodya prolifera JEL478]